MVQSCLAVLPSKFLADTSSVQSSESIDHSYKRGKLAQQLPQPISKPFAVSPPVKSKDISCGTHRACPPAPQRRRDLPVSTDEIDYREAITAFLENDNPNYRDYPGMVDWRSQHPREEQQGDPSN